MQDIVPSNVGGQKNKRKSVEKQVLRLQHRLPARLRRPIREELRRARRRGQAPTDELGIERRAIRTEPLTGQPPTYRKYTGVESHTGDVYMKSRPEVQVSAPPYVGRVVRHGGVRKLNMKATVFAKSKYKQNNRALKEAKGKLKPRSATNNIRQKQGDVYWEGVRDLPYEFSSKEKHVTYPIKKQKGFAKKQAWIDGEKKEIINKSFTVGKRLSQAVNQRRVGAEPVVSFSRRLIAEPNEPLLQERSLARLPAEADTQAMPSRGLIQQPNGYLAEGKVGISRIRQLLLESTGAILNRQVAVNALILVMGCVLAYGVIWNLNGLGRGWQVMGSVQDRAGEAYGKLMSASSALAETNFEASEADFSDAARLIREAQAELGGAMASSQNVLRWIDVTGTVRSGQEILAAGEQLSTAGSHIAQAANILLAVKESVNFVEAITTATNELMGAEQALVKAEKSLGQVDSVMLPTEIRDQVESMATSIKKIRSALSGFIERSDVLLAMLGGERDKQYLLLFQNNHEIRPTGGFIGSIGLVNIDRGVVEAIDVNSVYDPDGQLKEFIEPPEPLKVVSNRWYLRDANWFVDFSTSARKVIEFFEKEGGPTVDGVIALTPEVIRELLKVTGPIPVPGYNVEVSYDNFWLITQDQVSYSYNKELNQPKKFLADLAPVLLNRLLSGDANSSLEALEGIVKMIEEKQLLVYLNNNNWEEKLRGIGWSGDLPDDQSALLAVNNANIAGHKSDQFMEQEIDYRLEIMENGTVEAVVMITRKHNGDTERGDYDYPPDENPAEKDNVIYQRVLVPKGSKLLEADGFTAMDQVPQMVIKESFAHMKMDNDLIDWQTGQYRAENGTVIGEEAGQSFYANWIVTKPGKTTVAFYRYRFPEQIAMPGLLKPAEGFNAYVVKQPGDTRTQVRVQVDLPDNMQVLHTVPSSGITNEGKGSVTYRGALRKDLLVGMVFTKVTD